MNKVVIAAHKFNPSHLSHIVALTTVFLESGYRVYHRVSMDYINLQPDAGLAPISFVKLFKLNSGDVFINIAPSLAGLFEIFLLKCVSNIRLIYFLHEPFTSFKSYLNSGFSIFKVLYISVVALVSNLYCKFSDVVVLFSSKAYEAAIKTDPLNAQKYKKINLLFVDESKYFSHSLERKYISYIGTIAEDHAFGEFVDLIYQCIFFSRLPDCKFLIATKSQLPRRFQDKINYCVSSGFLTVKSGVPMTNAEINMHYGRSFIVWNAYKRSMQSGVLPKSYMFGTPVINCALNASEYFQAEFHGAIISSNYDIDSFVSAVTTILTNFLLMSCNCRLAYLRLFDITSQSSSIVAISEGRL